jgi:hypothetical protein
MLTLHVNDCLVEVVPQYKGGTSTSPSKIVSYDVNIVGYDVVNISGPREFSNLMTLLESLTDDAIAKIDNGGW